MDVQQGAKIRWGIMGTGWIAEQFANDLAYASNGILYAVGSRTEESARSFGDKHNVSRTYGTYEELAADPDVDAIYVATPHPMHKDNVMTALHGGKAVLCEKPFTVNSRELEEIITYASEHKLFLMEAMWTRYLPVMVKVREWMKEDRIGEVRMVKAEFGFRADLNPEGRLFNPELGGGTLLDAGIYPVSFASMILGASPRQVVSTAHIGETGVDEQFSVLLTYDSGRTAVLNGAIRLGLSNDAYIHGTKGFIHIPSFFNAKSASLHAQGEEAETFTDERKSAGYAFEAEEVGRCLSGGLTESSVITLDESLAIMKLLDEIRGQWGLSYPFEQR